MIRLLYLLLASIVVLGACAHHSPAATQAPLTHRIHTGFDPVIRPLGERLAIQFDDESVFIQVSDGRGGPPILYHGQPLMVERLKTIRPLGAKAARERFGDQTLVGGFLIELK